MINIVLDASTEGPVKILITNINSGREEIKTERILNDRKFQIDISKLQPGFYDVKFLNKDIVRSQKLQIMR